MSVSTAKRWVTIWALIGLVNTGIEAYSADLSQQAQPFEQDDNEQTSANERQGSPNQQSWPEPNPTITDLLSKITSLLSAPESQETAERSRRDLKAQEGMADYALAVAAIAGIQAFLTFVGIILVWRTLAATKRATSAAAKAAKAAEEAVGVTREIGEKQTRAYVNLILANVTGITPNGEMRFNVTVANGGQSPAVDFGCFCTPPSNPLEGGCRSWFWAEQNARESGD
ncbi:MAG: hypothetical protein ACR2Q4_05800 [Geminicoccaceae bacterium]